MGIGFLDIPTLDRIVKIFIPGHQTRGRVKKYTVYYCKGTGKENKSRLSKDYKYNDSGYNIIENDQSNNYHIKN